MKRKLVMMMLVGALSVSTVTTGCSESMSGDSTDTETETTDTSKVSKDVITEEDITIEDTIENSTDGEHAIEADGEEATYENTKVTKSGDSEGDEADFYGENATVFATNGATLDLSEMVIESDGEHANGVFSYGESTTVNISDSVIKTSGNCSGGLMTTGGGTMNATNLNIETTGNSSAAIRSDRGGGTVNVQGGSYSTSGTGSPAIYSTADITVEDATLTSTASQGIVVEGQNSVTLKNTDVVADNNTKNSDKSDYYQAVMIYQSMSGDADEGVASYTMDGGSLTNKNGDVFFVNNTTANINLTGAEITNEDDEGVFLRAAAAGWGNEGSNGGQVTLKASSQTIDGDMIVDEVSTLNFYLADSSDFTGAINPEGESGDVYVELSDDSKWTLTADSYITSLTCDADSIDLNGHKLYVNGEEYTEGEKSEGEAVEAPESTTSNADMQAPDGQGEKPEGEPPSGDKPDGEKPSGDKPDGDNSSENPPEKPE